MSYNLPSLENTTSLLGSNNIGVSPTDDLNVILQAVFNNGGGTVYMEDGTYTLTEDLNIPPGVNLTGTSRDNVIIDCDGDWSVTMKGSGAYTTGTIAITTGDTTVTGTGTTFNSGMVGQQIMIQGLWYEIVTFTDTTHLEIDVYTGPDVTVEPTIIASVSYYPVLTDLTIINSDDAALEIQYTQEPSIDNIIISDCGTAGVDVRDSVFPRWLIGIYNSDTNMVMENTWGFEINFSDISSSIVGPGVSMINSGNATIFDSAFTGNATSGIEMTDCSGVGFVSNAVDFNTDHGIEFISGNSDNQLYATNPNGNGGDGFKLTATTDRTVWSACSIINNGGFGINIANANCDNNVLAGVVASNNTSGSLSDSGTGTLKSTAVNIIP